ncbi:MAG: hypothetical protein R3C44_05655 [Chloroflexota bacterium]
MIQRIAILTVYFLRTFSFPSWGCSSCWRRSSSGRYFSRRDKPRLISKITCCSSRRSAPATFLATITIATRANRLENYPFVTRLQSRVEYLVAVLLASLIAGGLMQLLVAGLALIRGPELTTAGLLSLAPIWLGLDILVAVLALHATDLVSSGWSRVIIFGLLAILLILNSMGQSSESWFADRLNDVATVFANMNLVFFADLLNSLAGSLRGESLGALSSAAGTVFWPFRSITDAIFNGSLTTSQALAPAVLLLYGTILFLIAANLFATKDLEFVE